MNKIVVKTSQGAILLKSDGRYAISRYIGGNLARVSRSWTVSKEAAQEFLKDLDVGCSMDGDVLHDINDELVTALRG